MTSAERCFLKPGAQAPDVQCRTDEGTPVSLCDFAGRAIAVFLCGPSLDRSAITLIQRIQTHYADFLSDNCSPLVVSGENEDTLAALRDLESLPFLILSDPALALHEALGGRWNNACRSVLIFTDRGELATVVHSMPPHELVDAVLRHLSGLSLCQLEKNGGDQRPKTR